MSGSDELLRQAVRAARIGIFENDHTKGAIYWSPRMREIHGWGPDDPVRLEDLARVIHPDDAPAFWAELRHAHDPRNEGAVTALDHRIVLPDGTVRWLSMRGETEFAGEGADRHPVRTVGAVIDDTERRETLNALHLKNQAIDASLNAMAITDAEGRNIYVNPAFLRMWGYDDPAEILGRLPMDFFDGPAALAVFLEMQQTGRWEGELVAKRRDGTCFDVVLSSTTIRDAQGRVTNTVASFIDISEQKALQAKFLQAQKMESVGRLAGGVAHDFNNLLTVIRGYVELSMQSVPSDGVLYRRLMQVQKAADSAATLTRQLLAFSRKEIIDPQVLDLNDVLRRIQTMLPRLIGEDVHVALDMGEGLWPVRFDPGQCDQVLINLAVNARDAMPDGGVLTLSTANVRLDRPAVLNGVDVPPGDYVALTVRDTGIGITGDVMRHLFEPFFTTKAAGRGTGLGLAMVYGAVSQNGGSIDVESVPGHGAAFRVLLPRVVAAHQAPALPFNDLPGGLETVVLVEDDDEVRALAELALRHQGYDVWVCGSGRDAIARVQAAAGPPDLLVTDVIMPDMNGRVVAEQLTALCPGLRVLYTSGYPHDVIASHGVIAEGIEFLPKPYTVASLARKVRDVLDEASTTR